MAGLCRHDHRAAKFYPGMRYAACCGGIDNDSLRWDVNSKELSYFISKAFSRQGYMKEALKAVIRYLFETEKLACIAARSFTPNEASRALLASLGFHQDGLIPHCVKGYKGIIFDDTLWSLLREEYTN